MKYSKQLWIVVFFVGVLTPQFSFTQCSIFKSEIKDVQEYMNQVAQLTDSLSTSLEIASFDANSRNARKNANIAKKLLGEAVNIAYDASEKMEEAFYYSEQCGTKDVLSNTIASERQTVDTRNVIDEAFENAKKGITANTLGNLQYYMRITQRLLRNVKDSAEQAAYFADMAHYSCEHNEDQVFGSNK
ncbi:hypothetical protein ACOCEA_05035 [Maribacter sp. CXY002]|uniref:hypothetical protein n=1 Tax=Maribacter luteocoastalis TaxID=3407671 RepID=UPI003B67154D